MKNYSEGQPKPGNERSDYRITDNFELSLLHNQFALSNLEGALQTGQAGTALDKKMVSVLKERIAILQSIVDEPNRDAKAELEKNLQKHFQQTEQLEQEWSFEYSNLEQEKRGVFKNYKKNSAGENVAVFSDWSSGDSEYILNRKSLEAQLIFLKSKGMDTSEVEMALEDWPNED